ncbi:hypothetical protein CASFOL_023524 [Castilleja foliolosa]|uniref:Response regulatory domain-containing protein n=1 Tax=Castilleja foliolosa TaxID=1961234 RepID=A0ABD3CKT0_9LAMI
MEASTSSAGGIDQAHVLVVDDERTIRMIHTTLFKKYSCKVTSAESGLQALEILGLVDDNQSSVNETIPMVNLVCSDYDMPPGMNGYELLKKIKESDTTKDVPVVIASSDAKATRVNECLEAGAAMFISKPLKTTDVENLMKLM